VTIKAGTFVQWKNHDEAPHTVTATLVPNGATKFDSGELDSGNTFFVQLNTPGVYKYHCAFHPFWMRGVINVTST
jgi:plastocyanin